MSDYRLFFNCSLSYLLLIGCLIISSSSSNPDLSRDESKFLLLYFLNGGLPVLPLRVEIKLVELDLSKDGRYESMLSPLIIFYISSCLRAEDWS